MFTCNLCNRNIEKGKRVLYDGIKYECVTEEDIKLCEEIVEKQRLKELDAQQQELSQLCDNKKVICCKACNKYFKAQRIIETFPPQIQCDYCKVTFNYEPNYRYYE